MKLHEFQAKARFGAAGLPVPRGIVAEAAEAAGAAFTELGGELAVVKAQIHAGGRGKGRFLEAEAGEKGGVRLAKSVDEAAEFAQNDPEPAPSELWTDVLVEA